MTHTIDVLHVDDDPAFTDMVSTYLERIDDRFAVQPATSAEEGEAILADREVDCVISDYEMPGNSGIELLEGVRRRQPELPFILFTGKGSEEIASDAISAGVTDYLQKEGGTEQYTILANRVTNAVERHRVEREMDRTHAQLEAISVHSADAIVIIDRDSRIRFANPSVEEVFGYTPDELEGEALTTLMPQRHRGPHRRAIEQYLETGERTLSWSNVEFNGRRRDGSEVPMSVSYGEFRQDGDQRFIGIMRDISDRRDMESQLREREHRFRQLAENIQDVVWMADANGGEVVYVNPAFEDLWGRPVETLEDHPVALLEAVHPEDRPRVEAALEGLPGEGMDEEYRIERPDGSVRWVKSRAIPVENVDGEVYRVVGIASDVTDRKEREEELRRKQAELRKYELTVENSIDLLAGCGPDYELLFANEPYRRYHGIEDDKGEGRSLPDLLGDEWELIVPNVDRALDGEVVRYELERPGPEGDLRTLDISCYPLREDDGAVIGVVAAMRDLTRLHEDRSKRERIMARVTDAIVEVDANWRFTLVNDQAEALYGMDEASLLGRGFWEVFDAARGTRFEEEYREVMQAREPTSFVEYLDQLEGWFDVTAYPADDGGIALYFVDVTEHRERERDLRAERAFTEQALDALQDVFFVLGGDLEMRRWNDRVGEVTGHDEATIAEMDPLAFFAEEHRERVAEAIAAVRSDGTATVQADVVTAAGERIPYEFRATGLDLPEGTAVAGIGRDVSERT